MWLGSVLGCLGMLTAPAKAAKPQQAAGKAIALKLHPSTSLTLKATWSPITEQSVEINRSPYFEKYYKYKVARLTQSYGAKDFALWLPRRAVKVGEMWSIPESKISHIFKQFHPNVEVRLHNGGPNGAYGMLRAYSSKYAEVTFRIHVEFALKPMIVYFTPAQFTGRLLINRQTQKLVYARIHVPNQRIRNIDLNAGRTIDAVYVKTMELVGGDASLLRTIQWSHRIAWKKALLNLARKFYGFMQIRWRSVHEALQEAKRTQKPIHLFIVYGSLDDQSC
ncbi:MAG: hypothetical protein EP343_08270 [Deltaproteobacteria bacterium]|nr:MAG: hypothetical protein EP343_08270 [Deltaproteobacteria bacterium]